MTINKKLCPTGLKNNPNKNLTSINFITVHNTGNYSTTATAKNHANYLYGGSGDSQISWHYTVDKDEIWQSFLDTQQCWHAGNSTGNSQSIGVEICVNNKSGFMKACANAAYLISELLNKHNLTIDKVVQHNYWSGKNCPAELRSGDWNVTWDDFISTIKYYLNSLQTNTSPSTDTKYYRVQVGAYTVKANADAILQKVKAAGFSDAIIKYE